MKVELKTVDVNPQDKPFPKFMVSNSGCIVYMLRCGNGYLISGNGIHATGYHSNWVMGTFRDMRVGEEITITF